MRAARRLASLAAGCLALSACNSTLRSDLSEFEANQLVVALDSAAIAAQKVPQSGAHDRYRVEVPSAASARALALIDAQHLPKRAAPGLDELYADSGMWTTPDQERARHAAAVAGELSRSIERLQGVIDARVHLALPGPPNALDALPPLPKAAVLIRRLRAAPPVDDAIVRALVAGAVDGLSAERVTVVQVEASAPAIAVPTFVHVGPFVVERNSAATFRALLAAVLGLDLALALTLIWIVQRKRA